MIKNFLQFIKENVQSGSTVQYDPEEIVVFHLTNEMIEILNNISKCVVGDLYLNLVKGVPRKNLIKDPIDYLNIEKDSTLSFLKPRYFSETDKWNSTRRQKLKITRAIRDIYNENFLNDNVKQTDIELFSNQIYTYYKPAEVIELRGKDLLRAYNYKREIDLKKFGFTCANFGQKEPGGSGYEEPSVSWFDIYTKNPENIGVVVVIDRGKIVGRRNFQQGIQLIDDRFYKKGNFYTLHGNYYGESGRGGKYDQMILKYLKDKYDSIPHSEESKGAFKIKLKETRFPRYCPFDSMYVNFNTNELSNKCFKGSTNTYKARCPADIVLQREKEEEQKRLSQQEIVVNIDDPESSQK